MYIQAADKVHGTTEDSRILEHSTDHTDIQKGWPYELEKLQTNQPIIKPVQTLHKNLDKQNHRAARKNTKEKTKLVSAPVGQPWTTYIHSTK